MGERSRFLRPWRVGIAAAILLMGGLAFPWSDGASAADGRDVRMEPLPPRTKAPSVVWDRYPSQAENPVAGGFCQDTYESCRSCPEGMVRGTYSGLTGLGRRYSYFCCNEGDYPEVRSAGGVGRYGVCEVCGPNTIRARSRDEERYGRYSCFQCTRPGYAWRQRNGETVCLSCGSRYEYHERSGVCWLKDPPHPRVPERQVQPRP